MSLCLFFRNFLSNYLSANSSTFWYICALIPNTLLILILVLWLSTKISCYQFLDRFYQKANQIFSWFSLFLSTRSCPTHTTLIYLNWHLCSSSLKQCIFFLLFRNRFPEIAIILFFRYLGLLSLNYSIWYLGSFFEFFGKNYFSLLI